MYGYTVLNARYAISYSYTDLLTLMSLLLFWLVVGMAGCSGSDAKTAVIGGDQVQAGEKGLCAQASDAEEAFWIAIGQWNSPNDDAERGACKPGEEKERPSSKPDCNGASEARQSDFSVPGGDSCKPASGPDHSDT